MKYLILFLITSGIWAANPLTGRTFTWNGNVGIIGGIPIRSIIFTNCSPGASAAQINAAISACPSNQVVFLLTGTYSLSGDITMKSGVTLRGAGPTLTILTNTTIIASQSFPPFDDPAGTQHRDISAGLTQESTSITVSSTPTTISVGTIAHIDQLNDTNTAAEVNPDQGVGLGLYASASNPNDGRDRYKNQAVRIVGISGTTVTIDPPIHATDWDLTKTPQLWGGTTTPFTMIGIEDLAVHRGATDDNCIDIQNYYQCWVKNCNFKGGKNVVFFRFGSRAEVRHCTLIGPCFSDPYGVSFYNSSGCWAEDNIINGIQNPAGRGAAFLGQATSGSAWTYNFHRDAGSDQNTWQYLYTIQTHGGHCEWNLSEGNVGVGWTIEGTWGSAQNNVDIRSRWFGWDILGTQTQNTMANVQAVTISATNRFCSIVGSVLGTAGKNNVYEDAATESAFGSFGRVYFIGGKKAYWATASYDSVAYSTLVRAMNWDSANNDIVTGGYTIDDIPNSLIYSSKPSFFGTMSWPAVSPTDLTQANSLSNNPAAFRYMTGNDPPSDGGGSGSSHKVIRMNAKNIRIGTLQKGN